MNDKSYWPLSMYRFEENDFFVIAARNKEGFINVWCVLVGSKEEANRYDVVLEFRGKQDFTMSKKCSVAAIDEQNAIIDNAFFTVELSKTQEKLCTVYKVSDTEIDKGIVGKIHIYFKINQS